VAELRAKQERERADAYAEAQTKAFLQREEEERERARIQMEEQARASSPASLRDRAMATLINMGFADRRMNAALLDRFHGDVEAVVNHLLQHSDDAWWATRH